MYNAPAGVFQQLEELLPTGSVPRAQVSQNGQVLLHSHRHLHGGPRCRMMGAINYAETTCQRWTQSRL